MSEMAAELALIKCDIYRPNFVFGWHYGSIGTRFMGRPVCWRINAKMWRHIRKSRQSTAKFETLVVPTVHRTGSLPTD
jgi:hypothetical protein